MEKVKVNNVLYDATIYGKMSDGDWDGRSTKSITLEMSYSDAVEIFQNNVAWSIVQDEEEWDNSEYCLSGDITDHRNGKVTIKMGKPTELESTLMMLL